MKKSTSKLILSKDALRELNSDRLEQVVGAATNTNDPTKIEENSIDRCTAVCETITDELNTV